MSLKVRDAAPPLVEKQCEQCGYLNIFALPDEAFCLFCGTQFPEEKEAESDDEAS